MYTGVQSRTSTAITIFKQVYPEVMEAMDSGRQSGCIRLLMMMVAYSGQKADKIATAQTVAQQLERVREDVRT